MKKVLLVHAVALVVAFSLQGCVAASMIGNIAAAGIIGGSAQERKANNCAAIDTQAEKDKVSRIERNRRMSSAGCPI